MGKQAGGLRLLFGGLVGAQAHAHLGHQRLRPRCDIAIEVKRKLPDCRVYLICEDGHPEKLAALEKAAELKLIDGYCIGYLSAQQVRTWLDETEESMKTAASPPKNQEPGRRIKA